MNYSVLTLKRSDFDSLSKDEQVFFLQSWHVVHQLEIIQKALLATGRYMKETKGHELSAHVCQYAYFTKLLAGVLWEAWLGINKGYYSTALKEKSLLPQEAQDSLKSLGQYFSKKNLIDDIRNNFSFHSDLDKIASGIHLFPKDEHFDMVIPEPGGTHFCPTVDHMINGAMLHMVEPKGYEAAIKKLYDELVTVAGWMRCFCEHYCFEVCRPFDNKMAAATIERDMHIDDVRFPYFIRMTQKSESKPPASGSP